METALDTLEASMNWGWVALLIVGIIVFFAFVCYGWQMLRLFFKF